ncbi:MAG: AAA family ATPase [Ectothiorhodospiraceae bacterium AqS1]|nr:AAA family ATPase [Ectothiorhodospiraceae bacterium AqS1]MBF2761029.1 AAA family ATPase [Ectothiorhodospiraceae bacterium AqS1]
MTTDIDHDEGETPRIESIKVENYRSLKRIEIKKLTSLTVLIGPTGSGKTTILDALDFLSECFSLDLHRAWNSRGQARAIKTCGQSEAIQFEIEYRERPGTPPITYHLEIDEEKRRPIVTREWMRWKRNPSGRSFRFLDFENGEGYITGGEMPDETDKRIPVRFRHPDTIAVNTLGTLSDHPRVAALRDFIKDWHLSNLSTEKIRSQPEAGPQKRLSKDGSNLADVIQSIKERHPKRLESISSTMRRLIPRFDSTSIGMMDNAPVSLQTKDIPFERPISIKHTSDGTLKILAYLTLLHDPTPPGFIGIREPENSIYPLMMQRLGEEFRGATGNSQLLITTHSPFLLDAMNPEEVRFVQRDRRGFTDIETVADIPNIMHFFEDGASLGNLWTEGYFSSSL